jgi:gluconate 2-dehydrogenase gamma chain
LIVAAAAARVFPSDDSGPGAREAGVSIYIDRQLAGSYGRDRFRYTRPPFEEAPPELGYQGKQTPRDIYRDGLKLLAGFDLLSPAQQDQSLQKIESSLFFRMLRQNTIEGMFCDPMHGGNTDMVGWQLVGFPGPRMSNYDEIEKYYGKTFRPKPLSLAEATGAKVRPSEDEP